MFVKIISMLLPMLVLADREEKTERVDRTPVQSVEVSVIKPVGDHGLEVVILDLGNYSLRYYLTPDWTAGSMGNNEDGFPIPMKLDIALALRIDHLTGEIALWDDEAGAVAAAEGGASCTQNGCGGACCGFVVAAAAVHGPTAPVSVSAAGLPTTKTKACTICTCCDSGGCRVVLDTCNHA